ncbi:beta strand repeat-containing protein [Aeromonas cavernicola]|nr:Ig-like domain-containing protein [Aeromonas cavernicola]
MTLAATLTGCDSKNSSKVTANKPHIIVTPDVVSLPLGLSQQFTATLVNSDLSTQDITNDVQWSSSAPAVAAITASGNAVGQGVGTATISAVFSLRGTVLSATANLTVSNAIITQLMVTPANDTVPVGLTLGFTATALFSDNSTRVMTDDPALIWSSSAPTIAAISSTGGPGSGMATGLSSGQATITATLTTKAAPWTASANLIVSDAVITQLTVTPANDTVPVGLTLGFTATALLSDNTTQVVTDDPALNWVSNDPSIATISSVNGSGSGVATGISAGQATISATLTAKGVALTASTNLMVSDAVITQLTVTPANDTVPVGLTLGFTATALLSDNTTQVVTDDPALSWSSSAPSIATISNFGGPGSGIVTGVGVGDAIITATLLVNGTSLPATADLRVSAAVITQLTVTPASSSVPTGLTLGFTATARLSDNTVQVVTDDPALSWSSSAPSIATISSLNGLGSGVATGISVGTTIITASVSVNGNQVTDSTSLNVFNNVTLTALTITPAAPSIPVGLSRSFIATATFSDNSTQVVTDDPAVSWISDTPGVATITSLNGPGSGVAKGVAVGTTVIRASMAGIPSNSEILTVTPASLLTITIDPQPTAVVQGRSQQLTATGSYSDGSTQNLTSVVAWRSSDNAIMTTSGVGVINGIFEGEAIVYAGLGGVEGSSPVTVARGPGIIAVGTGLAIGSAGLGCLTDGNTNNQYDNTCVTYSLATPGFGWVAYDTHITMSSAAIVPVKKITFMGYWRQELAGSLGNWMVLGCQDPACNDFVQISDPISLAFKVTIPLTTTAGFPFYRMVFLGGPVDPNEGGGTANFAEVLTEF